MYLRSYFKQGHEYVAVVESVWRNGRPRQRLHLWLGRVDKLDRGALRASLATLGITVPDRF